MQLELSIDRWCVKYSGGEAIDKNLLRDKKTLCHTCEVNTVGAARIRAQQRAATAGQLIEVVEEKLCTRRCTRGEAEFLSRSEGGAV